MILKRLMFILAIPVMMAIVILLFFGGLATFPIYWIITGENEDAWYEVIEGVGLKLLKFCKLDKAL